MGSRFIADVHLGKLARMLRMLGFDTLYQNDYSHQQLLDLAMAESRVLLSRNAALAKMAEVSMLTIREKDPAAQLQQVIEACKLREEIRPFTRCMVCNGVLQVVAGEDIRHQLQAETVLYFHEFWQCSDCKQIYWKGGHYERMLSRMQGWNL